MYSWEAEERRRERKRATHLPSPILGEEATSVVALQTHEIHGNLTKPIPKELVILVRFVEDERVDGAPTIVPNLPALARLDEGSNSCAVG